MDGYGPPGFELLRRTRARVWLRQNAVLLGAGSDAAGRVTVAVLTTVIAETGREIAGCESQAEAEAVTEAAVGMIRRLDPLTGETKSERVPPQPPGRSDTHTDSGGTS